MTALIRRYAKSDAEGLARLRSVAYPEWPEAQDADWHRALYEWLETSDLASQMHRWVAEADGVIVGHLAAVPQRYRIGGQTIVAHTPADYMVREGHGFQAIQLMRALFRTCKDCVACDWKPEVMTIESRFGAVAVADLRSVIKPLDLSNHHALGGGWRSLAGSLAGRGLRVGDALLAAATRDGRTSVVMDAFDASFHEFHERIAAAVPCTAQKDAAFLRWRYGPGSPQAPVSILGVKEGKVLLGYAVLYQGAAGDGYILDLVALPGRPSVIRTLLRDAVSHFWRLGTYVVRYRFVRSSSAPDGRVLHRLGFIDRNDDLRAVPGMQPRQPYTLLVRLADPGHQGLATQDSSWAYSLGDGEASFWIR